MNFCFKRFSILFDVNLYCSSNCKYKCHLLYHNMRIDILHLIQMYHLGIHSSNDSNSSSNNNSRIIHTI